MASQSTMTEMDKGQYQQIQIVIEQNPMISGFDLYYLGFLSYYSSQLTLDNIFTHVRNIINLHNDGLITNEEKIEFLLRIVSKKVDFSELPTGIDNSHSKNPEAETKRILGEYFSQILKIIPQYTNISRFELFYLGRFHAICPNHKIAELFQHINNINVLVSEDLIDEETQIDFLLKILNKKIKTNKGGGHILNIPRDQEIRQRESMFLVKNEESAESKQQDKAPEKVPQTKIGTPAKSNNSEEQGSKQGGEQGREGRSGREDKHDGGNKGRERNNEPNTKKMHKSKGEREAVEDFNKENNHQRGKEDYNNDKQIDGAGKGIKDGTKIKNASTTTTTTADDTNTIVKVKGESVDEVRKGASHYGTKIIKEDLNKLLQKLKEKNTPKQDDFKTPNHSAQKSYRGNPRMTSDGKSISFLDNESNDSTSVDSGDMRITRFSQGSKVFSNLRLPMPIQQAVGSGGDSSGDVTFGCAPFDRSMNLEIYDDNNNNSFNQSRIQRSDRAKKKLISGVLDLLKRIRREDFNIGSETSSARGTGNGEMLPPTDSVRESQISLASEKPLLVEWKKRRAEAMMEEEKNEGEEGSTYSNYSDGEEETVNDLMKPVELGKRAHCSGYVKESKKKVKLENSSYAETKVEMSQQKNEKKKECNLGKITAGNKDKMIIEEENKKPTHQEAKAKVAIIKKNPIVTEPTPATVKSKPTPYFAGDNNDNEETIVKKPSKKDKVPNSRDNSGDEAVGKNSKVQVKAELKRKARMKMQKGRNQRDGSRSRSGSKEREEE